MRTEATATTSSAIISANLLRRYAPLLVVYGLIVAIGLWATLASNRFLTDRNLFNILRQAAFLGTVAFGQTLVILTGGIDLSVGSLVKLTLLTSAIWMGGKSDNIWGAILATLGVGALVGFVHAVIVTRLKVAPFIVTLGTYSILRSLALTISTGPIGKAAPEVLRVYDQRVGPVPVLVIGFLVLLLLLIFMLRQTTFGRYIYAVGGNEQVARLAGIPVNRVKFGGFIPCTIRAAGA